MQETKLITFVLLVMPPPVGETSNYQDFHPERRRGLSLVRGFLFLAAALCTYDLGLGCFQANFLVGPQIMIGAICDKNVFPISDLFYSYSSFAETEYDVINC